MCKTHSLLLPRILGMKNSSFVGWHLHSFAWAITAPGCNYETCCSVKCTPYLKSFRKDFLQRSHFSYQILQALSLRLLWSKEKLHWRKTSAGWCVGSFSTNLWDRRTSGCPSFFLSVTDFPLDSISKLISRWECMDEHPSFCLSINISILLFQWHFIEIYY